jgi:hypothetical protein
MVLVEHDLHNTELGLHLRLFGLASSGGSDKTEGEKWTASEAGKDQGASQLAVVASLPLPPWSFFRSEITRSVQGVATRCFDSAACPGVMRCRDGRFPHAISRDPGQAKSE